MGNMKDSGIEWIGMIPSGWDVKRIKYVTKLYTGNSISDDMKELYEDAENAYPYIATKDLDADNSSVNYENGMYTKKNDYSFRIAPQNSTLMCIEGGSAGKKIAKTNQDVSFVNKLCCFDAKDINADYLYMYLKSEAFREEFNQHISGLIGGVSQNELKGFYILLPSEKEQQLIADFLDDKVGKIDDILSDLRKQVETLLNYRKVIITNSVTKGIRKSECTTYNQNMIGEYASDYEIKRFKYIADVKSNLVDVEKYKEYIQVSPENIEKDTGRLLECGTVEEAGVISDNHLFFKGQIVYSKIRPNLNKVIIAPFDGLCSADMYPIETKQNIEFLKYLMLSTYFVEQVSAVTRDRVKMPKINQDELGNIVVVIPPLEEQQEIADYLDDKCAKIDELIKDKEAQIENMEKYKKSLIYEYVTGKKRVKGAE